MKRRQFIENSVIGLTAVSLMPAKVFADGPPSNKQDDVFEFLEAAQPPDEIKTNFTELLVWLKNNKWTDYLAGIVGIELDAADTKLQEKLSQQLSNLNTIPGFEDFAGSKLIEAGRPSMSLLYHALASPRVRPVLNGQPFNEKQYPTIAQLDALEDYIFSMQIFTHPLDKLPENYILAVFAYEYRPAYKTPDSAPYADIVFSRTGIARIGEYRKNYDAEKRCFINEPENQTNKKSSAVTPARYGLFLAKVLPCRSVKLYSEESRDYKGFIFVKQRSFLQPIRKIFDFDQMIGGGKLVFYESHLNEKLRKLAVNGNVEIPGPFKKDEAPFIKISKSNSDANPANGPYSRLVDIEKQGSSLLVSSVPAKLINVAVQNGKIIGVKVNEVKGKKFTSDRRYTSFKILEHRGKDISDYILSEGVFARYKPTRFSAPRNAPMFLNIRNKVDDDATQYQNMGAHTENFEHEINTGGYCTALFEDNICEGSISCKIKTNSTSYLRTKILPAYSMVAAPDFFPFVDSYDLVEYDKQSDSSFLEGGIENLSYCRLGPNPEIQDPTKEEQQTAFPYRKTTNTPEYQQATEEKNNLFVNDIEFNVSDTMLAIISSAGTPVNTKYTGSKAYQSPQFRDYLATSYLTDTAAFVFAPGWEASYSSLDNDTNHVFLATFGLGSPFPEDMKLCAAANGMWPVASPDAARTFQGSLEALPTPKAILKLTDETVPPTAIPLLDVEIGIHKGHPALNDPKTGLTECFGWDGEQGPFIEYHNDQFMINFTDIGRADYVENVLNPKVGFNMSMLRYIDCKELINRIECLRKCKLKVEGKKYRYSKLWLISAEKVADWNKGALALGVPENLAGTSKNWVTEAKKDIQGSGYLYVFAAPVYEPNLDPKDYQWIEPKSKRRRMAFTKLIVCQVTVDNIAWCQLDKLPVTGPASITWNYG